MTIVSQSPDSDRVHLTAEPLTETCRATLESQEHCCLGISPFNSYFTEERIGDIASWALRNFSSMHFFIPDEPAAYTLEAMGYTPEKAAQKARRQGKYLRNKVCRALRGIGIGDPAELILDSAALAGNNRYQHLLTQANQLFWTHPDFARDCLAASRWVLSKRLADEEVPTEAQLRSAVRYLLAELPLFVDTPGIVGNKQSVFCYHQSIPFLQRLYEGRLALRPAPRQGFAVLNPVACRAEHEVHPATP